MKFGFATSPFLGPKILAIYAVVMTAVAGGILLMPSPTVAPNVTYNLFKVGQTVADPTLLANGWKPLGYGCQAANPQQIALGSGSTVCGYSYRTATHNLITYGGIDWLACRMASWTAGPNNRCTTLSTSLSKYIALSMDNAAPAIGNCASNVASCSLLSEFVAGACASTFDNGLVRAAGTVTYTNDTGLFAQTTIQVKNTFTAQCPDNGVQKSGLFTAGANGIMVFVNTFSSTNLVNQDTLAITWSIIV